MFDIHTFSYYHIKIKCQIKLSTAQRDEWLKEHQ